jgi:hypothetical protein
MSLYSILSVILLSACVHQSPATSSSEGGEPAVVTTPEESSKVQTTPTGMQVETPGKPKVRSVQKKCSPQREPAGTKKPRSQVAIGIEKSTDSKAGPSAYTQFDDCK